MYVCVLCMMHVWCDAYKPLFDISWMACKYICTHAHTQLHMHVCTYAHKHTCTPHTHTHTHPYTQTLHILHNTYTHSQFLGHAAHTIFLTWYKYNYPHIDMKWDLQGTRLNIFISVLENYLDLILLCSYDLNIFLISYLIMQLWCKHFGPFHFLSSDDIG